MVTWEAIKAHLSSINERITSFDGPYSDQMRPNATTFAQTATFGNEMPFAQGYDPFGPRHPRPGEMALGSDSGNATALTHSPTAPPKSLFCSTANHTASNAGLPSRPAGFEDSLAPSPLVRYQAHLFKNLQTKLTKLEQEVQDLRLGTVPGPSSPTVRLGAADDRPLESDQDGKLRQLPSGLTRKEVNCEKPSERSSPRVGRAVGERTVSAGWTCFCGGVQRSQPPKFIHQKPAKQEPLPHIDCVDWSDMTEASTKATAAESEQAGVADLKRIRVLRKVRKGDRICHHEPDSAPSDCESLADEHDLRKGWVPSWLDQSVKKAKQHALHEPEFLPATRDKFAGVKLTTVNQDKPSVVQETAAGPCIESPPANPSWNFALGKGKAKVVDDQHVGGKPPSSDGTSDEFEVLTPPTNKLGGSGSGA